MSDRILIVDDTPANIHILAETLKGKGYQLSIATSGKQALEVLEKIRPDLILLDVMMPEMDGFETCRRIKSSETLHEIPIIFLTAKIETADIVAGFELGAVDYVVKPFNSHELLARINTHLEIDHLRRDLAQKNEALERAHKREMDMGFRVQAQLIPTRTPEIAGWEFAASWDPAREVSGDYYDFIRRNNSLGVVIADVSGKGLPAAIFMATARSIVREKANTSQPPAESFTQANALISADAARGMFITLFYMDIDPATRTLTYVNCGHNPPFWYKSAQKEISEIRPTGAVLGVHASLQCKQEQITLSHNDVMVLYTDGITEAFNEDEQEFGEDRLKAIIHENAQRSPKEILSEILKAVAGFAGSAPQSDDRTMVIMKCV